MRLVALQRRRRAKPFFTARCQPQSCSRSLPNVLGLRRCACSLPHNAPKLTFMLATDCAYEGYRTHLKYQERQKAGKMRPGEPSESTEVGIKVFKRAIFQGTASMLFRASRGSSIAGADWCDSCSDHPYGCQILWQAGPQPQESKVARCHSDCGRPFNCASIAIPRESPLGTICPLMLWQFDEPVEHFVDKGFGAFPFLLITSLLTVETGFIERKLGLPVNEEPVKSTTLPPELQAKKDL